MKALYSLLLVGLFFWGWSLSKKHLCNTTAPTTEEAAVVPATSSTSCNTLSLKYKNAFNVSSASNFSFPYSSIEYLDPSDDLLIATSELISFLEENPKVAIQVKGLYVSGENNESEEKSLGLARAKNIKSFFLDQGVIDEQVQVIGKKIEDGCVEKDVLLKGCAIAFGEKK